MNTNIEQVITGAIETNCWLYALGDAEELPVTRPCVVIDPGDEARLIIARLRGLNWVPRYIFLTHGHFDHLLALPDLLESFGKEFPGPLPRIGIHRLDAAYLGKDALSAHRKSFAAAGGNPARLGALLKPLPEADILFEEGDTAGPFRVLHTPGHTPGSAGFYDEKNGVLFSGDTLFRRTWGRTDLPGGNWDDMVRSLKRLVSLKKETVVYPGHGDITTIGEETVETWLEF